MRVRAGVFSLMLVLPLVSDNFWKVKCLAHADPLTLRIFSEFRFKTRFMAVETGSFLTLARLVDLPTPFTPQKVMTKGRRWLWASITSLRISTLRFGCRICTSESCRACFTVEATAANTHLWRHVCAWTAAPGQGYTIRRGRLWMSTHWWMCP